MRASFFIRQAGNADTRQEALSSNSADVFQVFYVNTTSRMNREQWRRSTGTVYKYCRFVRVPTQTCSSCTHTVILPGKALQMLNRFDNNELRSHDARTEFEGNYANTFSKQNKQSTTVLIARTHLIWLHLPMAPFKLLPFTKLCKRNTRHTGWWGHF